MSTRSAEDVVIGAPTLRQRAVAALTRRYPFLSGCGTVANSRFARAIAPDSPRIVWADAPGGRVLAPLDDYVGRAAYYVGDVDRKISTICRSLVRPGDTVIDVGANLGTITVLLADLVGPAGRVLAFEPNPRMIALLRRATASLGQVEVHPVALGDEEAMLDLIVPGGNSGAASLVAPRQEKERVAVRVARLSRILEERKAGAVRLMKIDVEGYEPQVLAGARESFARTPPDAIVFELNGGAGQTEHPTFRALDGLGYRFFAIRRTLLHLRLDPWEPGSALPTSHDFVALHRGPRLEGALRALHVDPGLHPA